jgi:hypothetical protein
MDEMRVCFRFHKGSKGMLVIRNWELGISLYVKKLRRSAKLLVSQLYYLAFGEPIIAKGNIINLRG